MSVAMRQSAEGSIIVTLFNIKPINHSHWSDGLTLGQSVSMGICKWDLSMGKWVIFQLGLTKLPLVIVFHTPHQTKQYGAVKTTQGVNESHIIYF